MLIGFNKQINQSIFVIVKALIEDTVHETYCALNLLCIKCDSIKRRPPNNGLVEDLPSR